jgi:hypothetical protein
MTQPDDLDIEAPEADAAEQATYADPADDDEAQDTVPDDIEVPEWDAVEQSRPVPAEDDYR